MGTFSSTFTTTNATGPTEVAGTGGLEYRFGFPTSTNAQNRTASEIGVALIITPAAGFILDSVTVFQSAFQTAGVNGGFDMDAAADDTTTTGINPGLLRPTYTIAGFGGSDFDFSVGSAGSNTVSTPESYVAQITTPTTVGGDITFDQVPVQLENGAVDDWFVTLNDVNAAGDTVNFSSALGNTFANEVLSFDASFSPVPEPSSTALLGLSALGLLARRRR